MKRTIPSILILFLLLTACGGPASSSEDLAPTWQEQYDLGVRYLSEGNYEEAIIAFTAAIEIDPKRAEAYVGRGDAYVLSGETEENLTAARTDYETAIGLDDTLADAYLGLADVYIRQGDLEAAQAILEQGLEATADSRLQTMLDEQVLPNVEWPRISETVLEDGGIIYIEIYEDGSTLHQYTSPQGDVHVTEQDPSGRTVRYEYSASDHFYIHSFLYQYQENSAEVTISFSETVDGWQGSTGFSHTMLAPTNRVQVGSHSFGSVGGSFEVCEYEMGDIMPEIRRTRYDVDESGAVTAIEEISLDNTVY